MNFYSDETYGEHVAGVFDEWYSDYDSRPDGPTCRIAFAGALE